MGAELHIGFWWENLTERGHLKDLSVNGSITLEWTLKISVGMTWTGLMWLRIRTSGEIQPLYYRAVPAAAAGFN
jgi:hypothetical protein